MRALTKGNKSSLLLGWVSSTLAQPVFWMLRMSTNTTFCQMSLICCEQVCPMHVGGNVTFFTTAKAHFQVQQGVETPFSKAKTFSSSYHCFSIDYWELTSVKLLGLLSDIAVWDLLLQKSLARFEPLTCGAEHRPTPLKLKAELHQLH